MTDTAAAPSARPASCGDAEEEVATTRRPLERAPHAHWDWKPHEKSMSLGQLAGHLAELTHRGRSVVLEDVCDVGTRERFTPANREEVLRAFDQGASALSAAVNAAAPDAWGQTW